MFEARYECEHCHFHSLPVRTHIYREKLEDYQCENCLKWCTTTLVVAEIHRKPTSGKSKEVDNVH